MTFFGLVCFVYFLFLFSWLLRSHLHNGENGKANTDEGQGRWAPDVGTAKQTDMGEGRTNRSLLFQEQRNETTKCKEEKKEKKKEKRGGDGQGHWLERTPFPSKEERCMPKGLAAAVAKD